MADVHSAARKTQMYKDPVTGKMKVRMVPVELDVKSEKILTPAEKSGRERIAKKLPMKDFKKRYGDDAMQVKMATATKIAKKKYDGDNETSGMDETKGAPKGYHFTRSGKLRKGDADVDGPGGKKLRADPLDKQRSKIPPLPEEVEENFNWKVSHAGKDVHVKAPHAGAAVKKAQKGFGNMDLTKAKITNLGKVGTPATEATDHDALAKKYPQFFGGGRGSKNTHNTDSGTAKVTGTHVHFDNSGYKQKFTHAEVGKMDKGGKVRGFGVDKSNPYHGKNTSVYSNGDEEHHLPNKAKKMQEAVEENYSYQPGKRVIGKASDEPDYGPRNTYKPRSDRPRPPMSARSLNKKLYGKAMGSPFKPEYGEATDKPPFDEPYTKKDEPKRDEFGNMVKKKNIASFLAKKAMNKQTKVDEMQEGLFDRAADVKTRAQRAKSAISKGMPHHVALAKYMVSTKDIETHTEAKVDEISTDLKKRYVDKAKSDYKHQQFSRDIGKEMGADKDTLKHYTRKMQKRTGGIGRATATMGESVEEAKSFDQKFKDHLKFATSKSKSVQDYMKKKVADRDAMNKANDPNAARKGYALSAVPPERAYAKARKKGMDPYNAKRAATAANRSLGGTKYRGRKLPEETQLDEMKANAAYTKAAKDIKAYAAKNGGIDKKDMMNFAADLDLMGRAPNILQAGRILDRINTRFKGYDTDVRDRLSMYLKKHGLME